ncbi:hypothetical protein OH76DRAFT_1051256 [Lentinus brumalis]|uniref:Uncharacterized protein n=1 Tax=Lentinus brumalis TaxID=2498619 RepID=A0A371CWH9_9APHY|nr:hypothetical protein OH76DRAFT_1051256 [Polyporus brumalis]
MHSLSPDRAISVSTLRARPRGMSRSHAELRPPRPRTHRSASISPDPNDGSKLASPSQPTPQAQDWVQMDGLVGRVGRWSVLVHTSVRVTGCTFARVARTLTVFSSRYTQARSNGVLERSEPQDGGHCLVRPRAQQDAGRRTQGAGCDRRLSAFSCACADVRPSCRTEHQRSAHGRGPWVLRSETRVQALAVETHRLARDFGLATSLVESESPGHRRSRTGGSE